MKLECQAGGDISVGIYIPSIWGSFEVVNTKAHNYGPMVSK